MSAASHVGEFLLLLTQGDDALAVYAGAALLEAPEVDAVQPALERLATAEGELAEILLDLAERGKATADELFEVLARGASEDALGRAALRLAPRLGRGGDAALARALEAAAGAALAGALLGALRLREGELAASLRGPVRARLGDADARVRANAAELVAARVPDPGEDLRTLLSDPVPRVRAAAAQGLWGDHSDEVTACVQADLGSSDPARRLAALFVLGRLPEFPSGTSTLVGALADPSDPIRRMACRALEGRESELDPEALLTLYLGERSRACQAGLAARLREGRVDVARLAVLRELDQRPDERRRAALLRALGDLGDPGDEAALVAHLDDPDDRVRAEAIEALGKVGGPRAVPLLERALADSAPRAAANAALALWRRGGTEAMERLARWLRGEDLARARSAAFALGEIGSVEVVAPLLEVAERLRDEGAESLPERHLLKQVMRSLARVRGGDEDGAEA